ncbi:MAG TPA: MMPL family transporter [Solirubrobacteraceae bacterium]|jgi:RND superfamily putative drug exporter
MIDRLTALATHRTRRVLIVAGAIFLLAAAIGAPVVSLLKSESSDFQDPHAQNQQVLRAIERATGQSATYGVAALVPAARDVRTNPAAAAGARRVAALLAAQPGFQRVVDYPAARLPELVSRDGRLTLVLAAFASRERSAAAVARVRPQLAGSGVLLGGNDVAFQELNERTSSDLRTAETLAFPLLLLLSFWVFRGLIAATLPLLVGGFAIVITFLLLRILDQFLGLSIFAVNLVTGVGLGLGIDYSLFILSRYREELARGLDTHAAIARTLQTAGRTILYGSLTVAGALASMLVFPLRFLYSMGIGGALVALSAGAVSLIVLPAVLVALGPRINALSPAWLQRSSARAASAEDGGFWTRLARTVMRRPGLIALTTAVALLLVASPALRLALTPADAHVLPTSAQPRQVAEALTREFAVDGSQAITIVAHAAPPAVAGAPAAAHRSPSHASVTVTPSVAALARRAQVTAGTQASVAPPRYLGRDTWEIELLPRGTDGASANQQLVRRLRALPSGVGGSSKPLVGGATAWFVDQKSAIAAHTPLALAILALVTGGFLFLMTGSLLLPLVALAMNLLTVAVGAGLLVLVFQDGHLSSLLGFSPIGGLEESNLVLLFIVAFALSTDYGVFLFGRIKEAHDDGLPTREAVVVGLERTGRLITAAALLFCVAIGAFVTSHVFFVKQLGFGAALAVAIDATIVRALLVPAIVGRLGERTWWAPRPLRRLHARIGLREGPAVQRERPVVLPEPGR